MLAINAIQTFQETGPSPSPTVTAPEDEESLFSKLGSKIKSIFSSDDEVAASSSSASATPTPQVITVKEKTPSWVFAVVGGVGAIVVGSIGYAMFRKPKSGFGKRRPRR